MRRQLAVVVWAVVLLDLLAVSLVLIGVLPEPPSSPQGGDAIFVVLTAAFGIVGARVVTRDSRNRVGWILWVAPTLLALSGAGVGYGELSVDRFGGSLPGAALLAWAGGFSLVLFILLTALVIPLIFPDGHLFTRRWRAVAALVAVAIGLTISGLMFDPALVPGVPNPFGIAGAHETLGLLGQIGAAASSSRCRSSSLPWSSASASAAPSNVSRSSGSRWGSSSRSCCSPRRSHSRRWSGCGPGRSRRSA